MSLMWYVRCDSSSSSRCPDFYVDPKKTSTHLKPDVCLKFPVENCARAEEGLPVLEERLARVLKQVASALDPAHLINAWTSHCPHGRLVCPEDPRNPKVTSKFIPKNIKFVAKNAQLIEIQRDYV